MIIYIKVTKLSVKTATALHEKDIRKTTTSNPQDSASYRAKFDTKKHQQTS